MGKSISSIRLMKSSELSPTMKLRFKRRKLCYVWESFLRSNVANGTQATFFLRWLERRKLSFVRFIWRELVDNELLKRQLSRVDRLANFPIS